MADNNITTVAEKLVAVNNCKKSIKTAIEAKGVTVGDVAFDTYGDKIAQIQGGSEPNLKAVEYTLTSGDATVINTPEGFDGMSSVTVTPTLYRNMSVSISENGTTNVTTPSGFVGINNLEIDVNVAGGGGGSSSTDDYFNSIDSNILDSIQKWEQNGWNSTYIIEVRESNPGQYMYYAPFYVDKLQVSSYTQNNFAWTKTLFYESIENPYGTFDYVFTTANMLRNIGILDMTGVHQAYNCFLTNGGPSNLRNIFFKAKCVRIDLNLSNCNYLTQESINNIAYSSNPDYNKTYTFNYKYSPYSGNEICFSNEQIQYLNNNNVTVNF